MGTVPCAEDTQKFVNHRETSYLESLLVGQWSVIWLADTRKENWLDFPGAPVVKSSRFHCRGYGFSPSVQFSCSVMSPLCNPMDCSTPGLPVHHQFPEFTQTHAHWVDDAIQPSHPVASPSPAFSFSQHQGLFKWVSSSHQMAKILEFQLQHQSFQ